MLSCAVLCFLRCLGLFKVALSMLGALQPRLLSLGDFESIVMLMREWKREGIHSHSTHSHSHSISKVQCRVI